MLTSVVLRIEDAGAFKQSLYKYFMDHASKVGGPLLDGKSVGLWDRLKYRLGEFFIYAPLKNTLGLSRVRVGYTAGEAIGPEIFDFFRSLGINLKQLYGQTEASVFITVQPDGEVRSDTVGIPALILRCASVKMAKFITALGAFVNIAKIPKAWQGKDPKDGLPQEMQGLSKETPTSSYH